MMRFVVMFPCDRHQTEPSRLDVCDWQLRHPAFAASPVHAACELYMTGGIEK
jgi:hypothetical protein